MPSRSRRLAFVLAAAVLAVPLSACGDDDDEQEEAAKVTFELTETADGKFRLSAPKSVAAGVAEIDYTNSGKANHEVQFLRVVGDHSEREVLETLESAGEKGLPDWFHAGGGVPTTPAGETTKTTQELVPGTYFAFDTAETEDEEGDPYFLRGAKASFEVTGDGDGELPDTDAKVTARDYSFSAEGLTAGRNELLFDNAGKEPHHLVGAPISPGKTIDDVREAFKEETELPLDFEKSVATTALDGGLKQVTELTLEKGNYALLCFITDRKGGPPHTAKGMISEATVE